MHTLLVAGLVATFSVAQVEVTLFPAVPQLNGALTQHAGTFAAVSYGVRDGVRLQVLGGGNWYSDDSAFSQELVNKFRVEAQLSSAVLWTWGLFGGVELEPFTGSFTLFGSLKGRVGLVLDVGAGAGGTRVRLTPSRFGDTGARFMATGSAGLRLQLGERVTVRLGLRDVVYSAHLERVNGCSVNDLTDPFTRGDVAPSEGCSIAEEGDRRAAANRLAVSSSAMLNNLSLTAGIGLVF